MSEDKLEMGSFVRVGNDLGVIVGLPDRSDVPEEHLAVWYGESSETGLPRARTVPREYCRPISEIELYH